MTHFVEQIYKKNKQYQGIIFLDRDGTINKYVKYLNKKNQVKILPKVIEGIKLLNKRNIAVVIITNQPIIARGMLTVDELMEINNVLVEKMHKKGVEVDAIYSCPHHPEKDHPDIPAFAMKFRIDCECRKPATAMLKKALTIYKSKNILGMIGDHERDVLAGKNLGIKTVLLTTSSQKSEPSTALPDFISNNFLDAVKTLL